LVAGPVAADIQSERLARILEGQQVQQRENQEGRMETEAINGRWSRPVP